MKGKVKFFDSIKGFGFVAGDDGTEYFVHQTALAPGTRLNDNDAVTFEPTQGDRGPKATNVALDTGGAAEPADTADDDGGDEPTDTEADDDGGDEPMEADDDDADLEELNKEQPAA